MINKEQMEILRKQAKVTADKYIPRPSTGVVMLKGNPEPGDVIDDGGPYILVRRTAIPFWFKLS